MVSSSVLRECLPKRRLNITTLKSYYPLYLLNEKVCLLDKGVGSSAYFPSFRLHITLGLWFHHFARYLTKLAKFLVAH